MHTFQQTRTYYRDEVTLISEVYWQFWYEMCSYFSVPYIHQSCTRTLLIHQRDISEKVREKGSSLLTCMHYFVGREVWDFWEIEVTYSTLIVDFVVRHLRYCIILMYKIIAMGASMSSIRRHTKGNICKINFSPFTDKALPEKIKYLLGFPLN